jgi:hypothetical protein
MTEEPLVAIPIQLAFLWVAVMLIYLLGDVLRIFSRDFPDEMNTDNFTKPMWLGISVLMVIPIVMIVVSVMVEQEMNRGANILAALFFALFNLAGLQTYPSAYDKFLLVVSIGFNILTIWTAANWT